MRKQCASCASEWEAKSAKAKYCSDRCRVRAYERRKAGTDSQTGQVVPLEPQQPSTESLVAATRAELEHTGRVDTALGQSALALAQRVDAGSSEPGSSFAALVREHRAVLAEAVKDAETAADPLDEVRARRERKRASG